MCIIITFDKKVNQNGSKNSAINEKGPNWGILENLQCYLHKILLTIQLWKISWHTFCFPHCVWNFHSTYFALCGTNIILLPVLWEILKHSFTIVESLQCNFYIVENITRCFPYCGNYQNFFHKIILTFYLWQSTLLNIWNISSTFLTIEPTDLRGLQQTLPQSTKYLPRACLCSKLKRIF